VSLDEATNIILDLADKGIIYDLEKDPSPTTPSGAIPVYLIRRSVIRNRAGRKVIPAHPAKFPTSSTNIKNTNYRFARIAKLRSATRLQAGCAISKRFPQ
jgi:hypothetical protein